MKKRFSTIIFTAFYCLMTLCVCLFFGCAPATPVENGDSNPDAVIPVMMEDFRPLYHPSTNVGIYMNDHTVFPTQGKANSWNVIGITNTRLEGGTGEKYFANGVGTSLATGNFTDNPATGGIVLNSKNVQADPTPNPERPGELCWAPHVVYEDGKYHMFYFSDMANRWDVGYAVSTDLVNWDDRTEDITLTVPNPRQNGLIYSGNNIAQTRDVMLLKHEDKWLMYATAQYSDGGTYRGAVAVYESENLTDWTFIDFALKNLDGAPIAGYSTCESPYVIKRGDKFILALTETDSGYASYHDTILFISDDPYYFGTYSGSNKLDQSPCYLGRFSAHCAEFIRDDATGRWYATTGGWQNMVKFKGSYGGVGIAEIKWLTPEEYETYLDTVCDGHESGVLNHSFENGSLENWVTTGDFGDHMVNDAFKARYGEFRDMVGRKTFCSYSDNNNGGDAQKGKMASNIFTIKENATLSFNIAGGENFAALYVGLVDASNNKMINYVSGKNSENARKVTWDLSDLAGKDAYIIVVDNSAGAWGHIAVDDIIVDGIAKNEWPTI